MEKSKICPFQAQLYRPVKSGGDDVWTFLVLPKAASDPLPRRGRTTVKGTLNGCPFQATLDPDGRRSHWLKVSEDLRNAAHAEIGEMVTVQISPLHPEPEPQVPEDFQQALAASSTARAGWEATTTVARVDWIHWLESAKRAETRAKRIENACDMLAKGKRRVCCFDPSGFYSKAFRAPAGATD